MIPRFPPLVNAGPELEALAIEEGWGLTGDGTFFLVLGGRHFGIGTHSPILAMIKEEALNGSVLHQKVIAKYTAFRLTK